MTAERKECDEVTGSGWRWWRRVKTERTVRRRASAASGVGSDTSERSGPEFYPPSEEETDTRHISITDSSAFLPFHVFFFNLFELLEVKLLGGMFGDGAHRGDWSWGTPDPSEGRVVHLLRQPRPFL